MNIIGIHASFNSMSHDPNIALIGNGKLLYAAEEERFLRYKTASGRFPEYALKNCLAQNRLNIKEITLIAYDGITSIKLEDKIRKYIENMFGYCPRLVGIHHADSHCYSAYYGSGFEECIVISLDGNGDRASGRVYKVGKGQFTLDKTFDTSESLGNFFTSCTNYLGFMSVEGEYKVMGMAAYAKNRHDQESEYLNFCEEKEAIIMEKNIYLPDNITSIYEPAYNKEELKKFAQIEPRGSDCEIEQKHFEFAGRVQNTFEETYIKIIEYYANKHKTKNIALAGGCTLNVLANYKLKQRNKDLNIYIYPAASDRGLAVGNAILGYKSINKLQVIESQENISFGLGNYYTEEIIRRELKRSGLKISEPDKDKYNSMICKHLYDDKVIGWFQGRSEYGPRALGFRSIIANARSKGIKDKVNSKIKFREAYRPFAPALLEEDFINLSKAYSASAYMTKAFKVDKHAEIFGETMHYDGSARVQTVNYKSNKYFYSLLKCMKTKKNEIPCLLNTSFNLAGEPIVESPADAIRTYISSELDILAIGPFIVEKGQ